MLKTILLELAVRPTITCTLEIGNRPISVLSGLKHCTIIMLSMLQSFLYFLRAEDINKDINQFPKGTRGNMFQRFRENVQTQIIFYHQFQSLVSLGVSYEHQKLFSTLGVVRNDFFLKNLKQS